MTFKVKDHYFNKAKSENYLARSIYKLEEIDKKFNLLIKAQRVLDLGYYPGSWTQYIAETFQKRAIDGKVVGIDIQEVNENLQSNNMIELFQMDIFSPSFKSWIGDKIIKEGLFDVILSDMAPKTTGVKSVDQLRSLELVESVFDLLPMVLAANGNFVIKVFESQQAQDFLKSMRYNFEKTNMFRPKATRTVSKEFFYIGTNYVKK
jgi:23S rRNA (uridine2552-2'-O)-methyltransferase